MTNPVGPSPVARPRVRIWIGRVALVVVALVALEAAARLADRVIGFSTPVGWMLDAATPERALDKEKPDTVSPPGSLAIRVANTSPTPVEPYLLGGVVIPHATQDRAWRWLRPDEVMGRRSIFVLGESAAYGYPYPYPTSFAALLDADARMDGRRVYIAARPGINSVDLVPMADLILDRFSPDALVIMAGNNEWIRWQPAYWPYRSRFVSALLRAGRCSRLVDAGWYLLFRTWTWGPAATSREDGFQPHAELTGYRYASQHDHEAYLPFDAASWSGIRTAYLDRFEGNLRHIVARAGQRGVPVILVTMPLRLRLSPAWKHPQPLTDGGVDISRARAEVAGIVSHLDAAQWEQAETLARSATALFPVAPLFPYLQGYALEQMGRSEPAREAYLEARNRMIGNLGSMPAVNEIIRRVAAEERVTLVDAEALFMAGTTGHGNRIDALMDDDCHPNPEGHRLLAGILGGALLDARRASPLP